MILYTVQLPTLDCYLPKWFNSQFLFLLLLVALPSGTSLSQVPLLDVGLWPKWSSAPSWTCVAENDFLYLTRGAYFQVNDIHNPLTPVPVSEIRQISQDFCIHGSYAFLAADYEGLVVLDISDKRNPIRVARFPVTQSAMQITRNNSLVCVLDSGHGFILFDVSNPRQPIPVGGFNDRYIDSIAMMDQYVIANTRFGMDIYDVSDETNPRRISSVPVYGTPAICGKFAYIAGAFGLQVIDLTNPIAPITRGSLSLGDGLSQVSITTNIACVAASSSGLLVVDVSDPDTPKLLSTLATGEYCFKVSQNNLVAYASDTRSGLVVVSLSDPKVPELASSQETVVNTSVSIKVAGGRAVVLDSQRGIQIVDVTDPETPKLLGNGPRTLTPAADLCIKDRWAFVSEADGTSGGVEVFDISNPTAPVRVGSIGLPWSYGLDVYGDHLFVANHFNGASVLDIRNPRNPIRVGSISPQLGVAWRGTKAVGNMLYLTGSYGIAVYDVSDPFTPKLVSRPLSGIEAGGIAVTGTHVYVSCNTGFPEGAKLMIYDVSTPSAPQLVGSVTTDWRMGYLVVDGNYAFVISMNTSVNPGIAIVDVRSPSKPNFLGIAYPNLECSSIAVTNSFCYVGNDRGIKMLKSPQLRFLNPDRILSDGYDNVQWNGGRGVITLQKSSDLRNWTNVVSGPASLETNSYLAPIRVDAKSAFFRLLAE